MTRANEHEGYYEDEDDLHDLLEPEQAQQRESLRRRIVAVFSTSYGLSALAHLAMILVLAMIVIATPPAAHEALVIGTKRPVTPEPPERPRDMVDTPPMPIDDTSEAVAIEEPTPTETPKGIPIAATNVHLDDTRTLNTGMGVDGGGLAGARGDPSGIGRIGGPGGPPEGERAVDAAFRWLAAHQSPDGRWDADGWQACCSRGQRCSGPGNEQGDARHDVGVSALAMLAFLGHGYTHRTQSPFRETVRKGLQFIRRSCAEDGAVGFDPACPESVYDQAIATMVLCEAYALTHDIDLKRPAQAAVAFCVAAQNPGLGWRYGRRSGQNDTSVTGWMVLALKAARAAELAVPDEAFEGALAWMRRATATSGSAGYMTPGGGSSFLSVNEGKFDEVPCMTAVSVLCRVFTGEPRREDSIRQGQRLLMECPPRWEQGSTRSVNFYYWYYATYAMHQLGGAPWEDWSRDMLQALCPTQRVGACEDGSWDPVDEWSVAGGRVYATAINVLTLEVYYRHQRAQERPAADERPR